MTLSPSTHDGHHQTLAPPLLELVTAAVLLLWVMAHLSGIGPGLSYYRDFRHAALSVRVAWPASILFVLYVLALGAERQRSLWLRAFSLAVPVGLLLVVPVVSLKALVASAEYAVAHPSERALALLLSCPLNEEPIDTAVLGCAIAGLLGFPVSALLLWGLGRTRQGELVPLAIRSLAYAALAEFCILGVAVAAVCCRMRAELVTEYMWAWDTYVYSWIAGLLVLFFSLVWRRLSGARKSASCNTEHALP